MMHGACAERKGRSSGVARLLAEFGTGCIWLKLRKECMLMSVNVQLWRSICSTPYRILVVQSPLHESVGFGSGTPRHMRKGFTL
jgi:hypothetical protein